MEKLRRLWQPRNPLFWMMVAFNALSSLCSWALRALPLNNVGLLLVSAIALMNVGFGLLAAWKLMQGGGSSADRGDGPAATKTP
jgi:hypothetical protein